MTSTVRALVIACRRLSSADGTMLRGVTGRCVSGLGGDRWTLALRSCFSVWLQVGADASHVFSKSYFQDGSAVGSVSYYFMRLSFSVYVASILV